MLRTLEFQSKRGDEENPICALPSYRETVLTYLPALVTLDGLPSQMRNEPKQYPPSPAPIHENRSPNQIQAIPSFVDNPGSNLSIPLSLTGKDSLITQLYNDVKTLHGRMAQLSKERNEALDKYNWTEDFYSKKLESVT